MTNIKFGKHQPSLIVLALMVLGNKSIGRYELSGYLNQSLAKTRSLLELLVTNGIASSGGRSSGKKGTSLTNYGYKLHSDLSKYFQLIINPDHRSFVSDLIPNKKLLSLLFFNSEIEEITGLYERDLAVRNGAGGAITLVNKSDKWQFPDGFQTTNNISEGFELSQLFNTCVIAFGDTLYSVSLGSIAVADYYLYDEIIKILSEYLKNTKT